MMISPPRRAFAGMGPDHTGLFLYCCKPRANSIKVPGDGGCVRREAEVKRSCREPKRSHGSWILKPELATRIFGSLVLCIGTERENVPGSFQFFRSWDQDTGTRGLTGFEIAVRPGGVLERIALLDFNFYFAGEHDFEEILGYRFQVDALCRMGV